MGEDSRIEWTDHTFNTWWGCVRVSPACDHCYAEASSKRFGFDIWGADKPRRFFGAKHWAEPLRWQRLAAQAGERHRVFCASMSDICEHHPDPVVESEMDACRRRLADLILQTPDLDWLLLTKRPERFGVALPLSYFGDPAPARYPANVWGGTTMETDKYIHRAHRLMGQPFAVRFLSVEPMLGPVHVPLCRLCGCVGHDDCRDVDGHTMIHWVIAGFESGRGARPGNPDWVRKLRDRCVDQGVAFFFKQWGEFSYRAYESGTTCYSIAPNIWNVVDVRANGAMTRAGGVGPEHLPGVLSSDLWAYERAGKAAAGRLLDGRTWDEIPEVAHGH